MFIFKVLNEVARFFLFLFYTGAQLINNVVLPQVVEGKKKETLSFKQGNQKILELNIQKMKIMASSPITSWQIDGETVETVADFIFWGSKITADGDCSHEIKRCLLLGRKAMTNLDSTLKSRDVTLPTKSVQSKLWFFPWSCMDLRVGL